VQLARNDLDHPGSDPIRLGCTVKIQNGGFQLRFRHRLILTGNVDSWLRQSGCTFLIDVRFNIIEAVEILRDHLVIVDRYAERFLEKRNDFQEAGGINDMVIHE
jgi:hypothetical protein